MGWPTSPAVDLREDWWKVGSQSTSSCVGWGDGREAVGSVQWMGARETDRFMTRPTTFIEPERTSLKGRVLDVARKYRAGRDATCRSPTTPQLAAIPGSSPGLSTTTSPSSSKTDASGSGPSVSS
jgi:hypothetical protein